MIASIIAHQREEGPTGGVTYHERVFVRLHRDEALAERLKDKERVIHGEGAVLCCPETK